ncbi:MAG: hypothetical protein RMM98_16600 [Acidobacteriota bacterium]|nr:hypothetical protein [Blastocatellia bacterium]MDW8241223.1 hypothetical protein [Acidobacteriota bacterium]
MISPDLTTHLSVRFRTVRLITLSVLASILFYVFAAYLVLLSSPVEPARPWQQHTLVRTFYGVAAVVSIGVILARRAFFSSSRLWRVVESRGLKQLVDELTSKTIILLALSDVVGLLGLVLSVLTKSFEPMWRLGAVSALLIVVNMPRRSAWERTVEDFSRYVYEEPDQGEQT